MSPRTYFYLLDAGLRYIDYLDQGMDEEEAAKKALVDTVKTYNL